MLGATKKRPTKSVELRFRGPADKRDRAVKALRSLGFREERDSIPWREALPFSEKELPGACLVGAREKEGLTQVRLAELTGIPQRHISEMERGKRTIGKERAKKLADALDVDYRVFL
jgi:ribosome-binding protein aMBF1 (putative translation factor)